MTNQTTQKEFVITREFKAPRQLVFQTWTDLNHLKNWSGPKGSQIEYIQSDLREGGTVFYKMANPSGEPMYGKAIYQEINPFDKIVYLQHFSNAKGEITRHPMSATWPLSMKTTIRFEDAGANTKLTLTWTPIDATTTEMETFVAAMAGMTQGWNGSFEVLDGYIGETNARSFNTVRMVNAPREKVWEAWTNPEHVKHWWGPNGFTNTIHKMEVKPGGQWDYMMHGPDGKNWPNLVSYHQVKKPELLVYDHGDSSNPKMFFVTVSFEAVGNQTKLSMMMLFTTKQERDETIERAGAVEGQNQTMARLEAYLPKVK